MAILRNLLFALIVLLFIFTLGTAFRLLHDDLSISQLWKILPIAVFYTLPYLLPVSLLVATTATYGQLVAEREVLAMRAAGMTPFQIMIPGLALGLFMTVLTLPLESSLLPHLHWKKWALTSTAIEEFLTLGSGQHKSARFDSSNLSLYIREFREGKLSGVILRKNDANQAVKLIAQSGQLRVDRSTQRLVLDLKHVSLVLYHKDSDGRIVEQSRVQVDSFKQDIPLVRDKRLSPKDLSSQSLRQALDIMAEQRIYFGVHGGIFGATTHFSLDQRMSADLQMRFTTPFASLVFMLIGIPTTLMLNSENRLVPFFVSFLLVTLFFFVPFTVGKSLAGKGQAPLLWLWLGPMVGGGVGLLLCFYEQGLSRLRRFLWF